jgi:hypothetical protein
VGIFCDAPGCRQINLANCTLEIVQSQHTQAPEWAGGWHCCRRDVQCGGGECCIVSDTRLIDDWLAQEIKDKDNTPV